VNFGQRTKANITVTSDSPSQQTEHFVLSARVPETPGQSGILFDKPDVSSVGEQVSTPLDTIPLDTTVFEFTLTTIDHTQDTETDNITITDTPIKDELASANQPGTTASGISVIVHHWHNPDHHPYQNITDISMMDPIKLERSNQTPQLSFNIIELGYANNTSNCFTITPLTDTKPDEPNILNILNTLKADDSDPAINTSSHHQTDQRLGNIAVITAKSVILGVKSTKTDSEYHIPQFYRHPKTDHDDIFSISSTGDDKEITSSRGRGNEFNL